jgi:hypothetical protein
MILESPRIRQRARVLESGHPSRPGSPVESDRLQRGEEVAGSVRAEGLGMKFEEETADPGSEDIGFALDEARLRPPDVGDQASHREARLLQETPERDGRHPHAPGAHRLEAAGEEGGPDMEVDLVRTVPQRRMPHGEPVLIQLAVAREGGDQRGIGLDDHVLLRAGEPPVGQARDDPDGSPQLDHREIRGQEPLDPAREMSAVPMRHSSGFSSRGDQRR